MNNDDKQLAKKIRAGAVGIMATDTIYGLVGSALLPPVVQRIYEVKDRDFDKPFILLISDMNQLKEFSIELSEAQQQQLNKLWPGPVSVILHCPLAEYRYLHRGRRSLAFRLPDSEYLRSLVRRTGPIVATSANLAGQPTPSNIDVIEEQLPGLDFYAAGQVGSQPSRLCRLAPDGTLEWLKRS